MYRLARDINASLIGTKGKGQSFYIKYKNGSYKLYGLPEHLRYNYLHAHSILGDCTFLDITERFINPRFFRVTTVSPNKDHVINQTSFSISKEDCEDSWGVIPSIQFIERVLLTTLSTVKHVTGTKSCGTSQPSSPSSLNLKLISTFLPATSSLSSQGFLASPLSTTIVSTENP